jgi:lipopolysaccharide transport system permease protein
MSRLNRLGSETGRPVSSIITEILPIGGWQAVNVGELWRFRELLYFLVWRDVKVRYKQTILGAAWAILQPAMMMLVFTVFLGHMAKVPSANDPVFVYAGMLPWTLFANAIANAGSSMVNSEKLITKVYFPRLAVPLSAVGVAVVDFLIAALLLAAMMAWRGIVPGANVAMAPVILVFIAALAAGTGTLLAALTVAYRDFKYITPFLVQFWLFATPSVYSSISEQSSPILRALLLANPMSGLVAAFRASLFNQPIPWDLLAPAFVLVVLILLAGVFYFRRVESSVADII